MLLLRSLCIYRPLYCYFRLKHETDKLFFENTFTKGYSQTNSRLQNQLVGVLNLITENWHNTNVLAIKSCFNARMSGNLKKNLFRSIQLLHFA